MEWLIFVLYFADKNSVKFRNYFVAFIDHIQVACTLYSVFSLFNFFVLTLKFLGAMHVVKIENMQ